jgi:hypothetical protein
MSFIGGVAHQSMYGGRSEQVGNSLADAGDILLHTLSLISPYCK